MPTRSSASSPQRTRGGSIRWRGRPRAPLAFPSRLSVRARVPAFARALMDHAVRRQDIAGRNLRQAAKRLVIGREIRPRRLEELLEAVDDEIALLEGVEAIACMHDAQEVEAD